MNNQTPSATYRPAMVERLATARTPFDLCVIGGGATGLGVALDAAARGFSVALFESDDVAKGTSSRATKLVHGGVRYLAQGNLSLVREALRERAIVLANAAHLASPLPFVLPTYGWRGRLWDRWFYGAGLAVYDALAGSASLGRAVSDNRQRCMQGSPASSPGRRSLCRHLPGGGVAASPVQFGGACARGPRQC